MIRRTKLATIVALTGLLSFAAGMSSSSATAAIAPAQNLPTIDQLNRLTQVNPTKFAGIYIDPQSQVVHVNVAPGIDGATLSQMRRTAAQSTTMKIVLNDVPRSYAELNVVLREVTTKQPWAADTANIRSSWGIDPAADKVSIGLTTVTPQLQREAEQLFGDAVQVHQQARMTALDRVDTTKNVKVVHVDRATLQARERANLDIAGPPLADFPPYIGGDRMIRLLYNSDGSLRGFVQCTAGLVWNNGGSTPFMASAGHCGPLNYSWQQGYYDPSSNTIYETGPMGTAFANPFGEGQIDGMLLDNSGDYLTELWQNLSGSYTATGVTSLHDAVQGEKVCTDGSFTGAKCSGVISNPDSCDPIDYDDPDTGIETTIDLCHLATATSSTEQIVQSGDSGGPVFFGDPSQGNGVAATGIISAGNIKDPNNPGYTVLYTNRTGMKAFFSGDFDTLTAAD